MALAVAAAEQAGRVNTTIDPPPILDILITGRADDREILQQKLEELRKNPGLQKLWE